MWTNLRRSCLVISGAALLLAGCEGAGDLFDRNWSPFHQAAPPDVKLPAQRVQELRDLSHGAHRLSPQRQEETARQLSAAIAHEDDPLVRAQIARTLGHLPAPSALPGLTVALADAEAVVRVAACQSLGRRGDPASVELLAKALKGDGDQDVRLAAARALGESGSPEAVRSLAVALDDADPAMQRRGMEALAKITDRDYGYDIDAWRTFVQGGQPEVKSRSIAQRLRELF